MKFRKVPFIKLLLPYVCGIGTLLWLGGFGWQHAFFAGCSGVLMSCFLLQHQTKWPLWRRLFMLSTYCFLFLLAFETGWLYQHRNHTTHYTHAIAADSRTVVLRGRIEDIPVRTSRFYKLPLCVEAVYQHTIWKPATGRILIYADTGLSVLPGLNQSLVVKGKLNPIAGPANPFEFDYARFLSERNIFHAIYAQPKQLCFAGTAAVDWQSLGGWLKSKTVEALRESGLSADAFAICAALLVGYDDEIDSSTMSSFSHSGTLHVLSVSGLHTGVLYVLIITLFGWFDKHGRHKKLKCAVVLCSLLLLACITGFAPAVSRAVLMLSLVTIGNAFFRNHNTYNTLLVSAFVLLLINPYLLKDLGFLLSYVAVFGIIYLSPKLNRLYTPGNKLLKWLWDSSMLSVSATLFTLPLSLYYFHQFPNWFLLSNLIIIPLSMALMLLALLLLCVGKLAWIGSALVLVINKLTAIMLWCSELSNHAGWGYTDLIPFGISDLLFLSLLIVLFCGWLQQKHYRWFVAAALCCAIWLCASIVSVWRERDATELVIFRNKSGNSIVLRQGYQLSYIGDSLPDNARSRIVVPYLQHHVHRVMQNTYAGNFIRLRNRSLLLITQAVDSNLIHALHPNYLIIDNNSLQSLHGCRPQELRAVIATTRNSRRTLIALEKECRENVLTFHALGTKGAWTKEFGTDGLLNE